MKTLITLVTLLLFNVSINAQFGQSVITITSADHQPFSASFNNSTPVAPSNQINFTHIHPGSHYLEVYRYTHSLFGIMPHVQAIFRGVIQVPPNMQMVYMVNHMNQLVLTHSSPLMMNPMHPGGPVQLPNTQLPMNPNLPVHHPNIHHQINQPNLPINNNPGFFGMHPQNFQQLIATISATSFDSSKRNIARQGISSNNVSSQQVLEIIRLFSFESSRLEIAKFAYPFTVDKNNYYLVNNGFSFSSSIDNLNRFIGQSF